MQTLPTVPPMRPHTEMPAEADAMQQRRELAIKRIKEKNDFKVHLLVYLAVNTMLLVIWVFTGAGFFWPIFVMGFWGIGVVMHGYTAYCVNTITEEQIEREMRQVP
jgi:fatty acid desaturase